MIYNQESVGFRGYSGALIDSSSASVKYAGGSFSEDGQDRWDWAILKIEDATSANPTFTLSRVQYYQQDGCSGTNCGLSPVDHAPMITHMGLHEESGPTPKMFGLTQGHNHGGGDNYGMAMYVWHVDMDAATGNVDATNPNLEVKQLDVHDKSFWMGMRESMEVDGSNYHVHALVSEERKKQLYVRVNPASQATVRAIRINKENDAIGFEAVWIGSKTQIWSPSNYQVNQYEAYMVGYLKKYNTYQAGVKIDIDQSYAVSAVIEDDDSCVWTEENQSESWSLYDPSKKTSQSYISTPSFQEDTSSTVFNPNLELTIRSFDTTKLVDSSKCNSQETAISSVAPGTNSLGTQCWSYQSEGSMTFVPPVVTSPSGCTDASWLYTVVPSASLPTDIQFGIDADNDKVFWGTKDGEYPGSPSSYGSYNIQVDATLQNMNTIQQLNAFSFQLTIDCCASPTVITVPTVPQSSYTYDIGKALTVSLSGAYSADNACCTPSIQAPVIVTDPGGAAPPAGLFTVSADNLSVDILSTDATSSGPSGQTYKVTTSAVASGGCSLTSSDVIYTVNINNACESALFTVDSAQSKFQVNTAPSITYLVADAAPAELQWSYGSDVTSSITWTDPCQQIIQDVLDITTNPAGDMLDPSIFTLTKSGDDYTLSVATSNTAKAGDYQLRLAVYYQDYEAQTKVERDFMVRITDPCGSATLTIDDSIFKTAPVPTMTQFVNYVPLQISWTDAIVTSDVTLVPNPCPAFAFNVVDTATGLAPDVSIFTSDLASATKTLDVATSDMLLAGTYQLELQVYYIGLQVETQVSKQFDIVIDQYCTPTTITQVQFTPNVLSYELGRAAESATFTAWTTVPSLCNLVYKMKIYNDAAKTNELVQPLADPTLLLFDDSTLTVKVEGSQVFAGGDQNSGSYIPGTYFVEVEANNENNISLGTVIDIVVTVIDPCDKAGGISILPAIINPSPLVYQIYDSALFQTLTAIPSTSVTELETTVNCPPIYFDVVVTGATDSADSSLFTWTGATQVLSIASNDYGKVNQTFKLFVQAFYDGGMSHTYQKGGQLEISIDIADPCVDPVSLIDPGQTNPSDYAFSGTASFTMNSFLVDPAVCPITYACVSNTGPRTDLCTIDQNVSASKATFDPATGIYTLTSTELDVLPLQTLSPGIAPDTYVFTIEATSGLKKTQTTFTLTIVDPCVSVAYLSIQNAIFPAFATRYLRDAVAGYPWDAVNLANTLGVSVDCGPYDVNFFRNDFSQTAFDQDLFTDNRSTNPPQFELDYTIDVTKAGQYSLSYKVYLVNYPSVEVLLTAANPAFDLTILDPCLLPTIQLTTAPLTDQSYFISDTALIYQAPAFSVFQTWCEMIYSYSSSDVAVDKAIVFDPSTRTFTIDYSTSIDLSGQVSKPYTLTMTVTSQLVQASETFVLTMKNPCAIPSLNLINVPIQVANQTYQIGSKEKTYSLQHFVQPQFQASNLICGDVQFSAELTTVNATTSQALNETDGLVKFFSDGTFKVQTSDIGLLGDYEMKVSASLDSYPTVITTTKTIVPLKLDLCQLVVNSWILPDAKVPYATNLTHKYEEPSFHYSHTQCDYVWSSVTLSVKDQLGDVILNQGTLVEKSSESEGIFGYKYLGQTGEFGKKVEITVVAKLSDGVTQVESSYQVTYIAPIRPKALIPLNTSPYFLVDPLATYIRFIDPISQQSAEEVEPISLGEVYDAEGDAISVDFQCKNCGDELYFTYVNETSEIKISKQTPEGAYFFKIQLTDNNLEEPKTKQYEFTITIKPPFVFEMKETTELEPDSKYNITETTIGVGKEKEIPTFKIVSLSYLGELKIGFSQQMLQVQNLTSFTGKQIKFEIIPHESNEQDDQENFAFSWVVTEFLEQSMTVMITFAKPSYISAGLNRDTFKMTILEQSLFYSVESQLFIEKLATDSAKAPKSMPNTEFTKAFVGVSGGMGSMTNAGMLGNFVINLFLSGAMNMLWGLLHCLQIVAHFPLLNVMMPGNAQILFEIIGKIATFDIVPTEQLLEYMEKDFGIEQQELILTDNFQDFGYDSSDPIRNLQVMFIVITILTVLPVLTLLMRGLCFCSQRGKQCISKINSKIYWNMYIRVSLEAYLELSISGLIRYSVPWSLANGTQIFYTIASVVILTMIFAIFMTALLSPQIYFSKLETHDFQSRFGALTLGLDLKERKAVLFPSIFMLRRVLYAGMMIYWVEQSYFQIQFMIFKCSLCMLYVGYFRPFKSSFVNSLELTNEYMTLLCSYSLIMFSQIVHDPETRYLCGWQIIFLVLLILAINMSIIIFQAIRDAIKKCKLKYKKRQNMNIRKAQQKEHRLQQSRMFFAQQAIEQDVFFRQNRGGWNKPFGQQFQEQQDQMMIQRKLLTKKSLKLSKSPNRAPYRLNHLRVLSSQQSQFEDLSSIHEQSEYSSSSSSSSNSQQESSKQDREMSDAYYDFSAVKSIEQHRRDQQAAAANASLVGGHIQQQPYEAVFNAFKNFDPNSYVPTTQINTTVQDNRATGWVGDHHDTAIALKSLQRPNPTQYQGNHNIPMFGQCPSKKYKVDLMLIPDAADYDEFADDR